MRVVSRQSLKPWDTNICDRGNFLKPEIYITSGKYGISKKNVREVASKNGLINSPHDIAD